MWSRSLRRLRCCVDGWCDDARRRPEPPDQGSDMTLVEQVHGLNRVLRENVRFFLESGDAYRETSRSEPAEFPSAPDQMAVMVVERPGGVVSSARCPLRPPDASRRCLLLSLASSVAECAMLLGLGTGVYRRGAPAGPTGHTTRA